MPRKAELISKSSLLKEHGFTKKTIERLGIPVREDPNPCYRNGPTIKFYSLRLALSFKQRHPDLFATEQVREARRARAAKAVETKQEKLRSMLDDHPLERIRPLPSTYDELWRIARNHAQERHGDRASEPGINGVIATVRHEFTNYEQLLALISGKCGKSDAYDLIRFELDYEIELWLAEVYPHLEEEIAAARARQRNA